MELDALTAQGHDIQWGTNVLGPFLLTNLLMPALKASSSVQGAPARIVNTSSFLHTVTIPTASGIDADTFTGGAKRDAALKKYGSKSKG